MPGLQTPVEHPGERLLQINDVKEQANMAESEQVTGILDPAALENLREMAGGDTEFLMDLIDTFLTDAPQMLMDMRQALADGNAALLRRSAHSLKSNSAEFGATALSALCRELEELAQAGALDGVSEKITQAEAEYAKTQAALEKMRE
jgi:HPt (histidine-containing phosphotransfer) domain-containing protein